MRCVHQKPHLCVTSGHSFDHLVGADGQFGADNFDFASYDIERCFNPYLHGLLARSGHERCKMPCAGSNKTPARGRGSEIGGLYRVTGWN